MVRPVSIVLAGKLMAKMERLSALRPLWFWIQYRIRRALLRWRTEIQEECDTAAKERSRNVRSVIWLAENERSRRIQQQRLCEERESETYCIVFSRRHLGIKMVKDSRGRACAG